MAKRALDPPGQNGQPPCIYWAGRDQLILALSNGNMPEPGSTEYKTQARKVRRCLERLHDAKAIERIDDGRKGHNSVYKITLGTVRRDLTSPLQEGADIPPKRALGGTSATA